MGGLWKKLCVIQAWRRSAIPTAKQFRYVRARDTIDQSARPASHVKALYASVVAQVAIRTLHEIFEAYRDGKLETLWFVVADAALGASGEGEPATIHKTNWWRAISTSADTFERVG